MTLPWLLITWFVLTATAVTAALMIGFCHGWDAGASASWTEDRLDDA